MTQTVLYRATRWGALIAGGLLTAVGLWADPVPAPLVLGGFALLAFIAESGDLTLPYAGSVAFGVVIAMPAMLVIGPGYAALCAGFGQLGVHLRRRRPRTTLVFNSSQRAFSVGLAGLAWNLVVSGRLSLGAALPVAAPERVVPAALASIATYTLATHILVSLYSATRRALPIWTVLLGNAGLRFAATGALGSFGLLVVLTVLRIRTAPANIQYVLVLPIIGGVAFLMYDSQRQANLQLFRLYAAVTDLVQAVDLDQLLQRLAMLLERIANPAALWIALRSPDGRFAVALSRGLDEAEGRRLAETVTREMWGHRPDASVRLTRVADYGRDRQEPLTAAGVPLRSVMLAPLAAGPDLVGALGMVHPVADYFIAGQERAVAMLAAEAAVVVNYLWLYRQAQDNLARAEALQTRNTELLRESQRRAHQLALLNRAFMRVATSLAADEVFAALVDELHSTLGYPRVALRLVDGDSLRLVADRGYGSALDRVPLTQGIAGRIARTGQPALVLDVRRDPDYFVSHPMVTQLAGAPISSRGGVTGVITVESVEPVLSAVDLELLTTLAGYATLAIENARNYEEARMLATIDGLTGLPNRRSLWGAFERELARAGRSTTPLSVVMVEVDRFKQFNDTHGHLRGDEALRHVARVLTQEHRAHLDVVARYGGDEFVALLPQTGKTEAAAVAERIRRAVGRRDRDGAAAGGLTVSLGVATFPEDGQTIETLLRAADRSMYDVKAAGGDAVAVAPGRVREKPRLRRAGGSAPA